MRKQGATPVGGLDECIVPVLDHARCKAQCETLGQGMEVAENRVDLPSPHQSDLVCDNFLHEDYHVADCAHRARAEHFWSESDL